MNNINLKLLLPLIFGGVFFIISILSVQARFGIFPFVERPAEILTTYSNNFLSSFISNTSDNEITNIEETTDDSNDLEELEVDSFVETYQITKQIIGNGSIELSSESTTAEADSEIIVTAVADPGWQFSYWDGALDGSENNQTLIISSDVKLVAYFSQIDYYQVIKNTTGNGSIFIDSESVDSSYPTGTQLTITAQPDTGWRFVNWSGDLRGSDSEKTIQINSSLDITANFEKIYSIRTKTSGLGTVKSDPNKLYYDYNSAVSLLATASDGWAFAGWIGDYSSGNHNLTVKTTKDLSLKAVFKQLFTLTKNITGNGSITTSPNASSFLDETQVTLTAVADTGWEFVRWEGAVTGTANPATVTMSADKTVTAVFEQSSVSLTKNTSGNGSITTSPTGSSFDTGTSVQVTAVPDSGWQFSGWSGDLTGSTNPETITMDSDKTITATFTQITYTLSTSVSGNGSITKNPNQITLNSGDSVQLTAVPDSGYEFTGWSGDLSGTTNPETVTMDSNKNITATFEEITSITIDVWNGDTQNFGTLGTSQQYLDILGNVSDSASTINSLSYNLNGGSSVTMEIGPSDRRLKSAGDFIVNLNKDDMQAGNNTVVITATNDASETKNKTITVTYDSTNVWPRNYTIDWSEVSNVQDVAQMVDGKWLIDAEGVYPETPGYDRLLAIGDITWKDYQVEFPVTVKSLDVPTTGSSGAPGLGVLLRWQGHTDDPITGTVLKQGWNPHGHIAWWRWNSNTSPSDAGLGLGDGGWSTTGFMPVIDTQYTFKAEVEGTTYRVKAWESSGSEPDWIRTGTRNELATGSLLLLAHHVDARFGDITIRSLFNKNIEAFPGQTEAVINWTSIDAGTSKVEYGLTSNYELGAVTDASSSATHTITLSGLSQDTTYNYRVITVLGDGTEIASANRTFTTATPLSGMTTDYFNTGSIDTGVWTYVDPLGDTTLSATGTQVSMAIPSGTTHDLTASNKNAVRLIQDVNNTDMYFETKIDSSVTSGQDFQDQGLIIYGDANNFLRFDIYSSGSTTNYFVGKVISNAFNSVANQNIGAFGENPPMYLRVKRVGNEWTMFYSNDGYVWTTAATFTQALTVNQVGIYAGNAGSNPAHTALFDYFKDLNNQ